MYGHGQYHKPITIVFLTLHTAFWNSLLSLSFSLGEKKKERKKCFSLWRSHLVSHFFFSEASFSIAASFFPSHLGEKNLRAYGITFFFNPLWDGYFNEREKAISGHRQNTLIHMRELMSEKILLKN